MFRSLLPLAFLLHYYISVAFAASKEKAHPHNGILKAYDGKQMSYELDPDQNERLKAGKPVLIKITSGKAGRGTVIQDIHAPPHVCLYKIMDLGNYHKVVPKVKSIETYNQLKHSNGTVQTGATFNVGISFMGFTYYILLSYEPRYFTYTWTLDYSRQSDFDDNIGHWQVMAHPMKENWTRVLYSTDVRLPAWIPSFVVNFLTNTALVESTTWVTRESEKGVGPNVDTKLLQLLQEQFSQLPSTRACYFEAETGGASYDASCSEGPTMAEVEAAARALAEKKAAAAAAAQAEAGKDYEVEVEATPA